MAELCRSILDARRRVSRFFQLDSGRGFRVLGSGLCLGVFSVPDAFRIPALAETFKEEYGLPGKANKD